MKAAAKLRAALDDLALQILDEVAAGGGEEGVKFSDKVDAFKAVANYHVAVTTKKGANQDETPQANDFDAMKQRINGTGKPASGETYI